MSTEKGKVADTIESGIFKSPQRGLEPINRIASGIASSPTVGHALVRRYDSFGPIQKLNADELTMIFEMCSRHDWISPLRIAAVSRRWRTVVHNTPKAWNRITLHDLPPMKIVEEYLTRSRGLLVHTCLLCVERRTTFKPAMLISDCNGVLNRNRGRFACLYLHEMQLDKMDGEFDNLRALSLRHGFDGTSLCSISAFKFPRLRHLSARQYTIRSFTFPPTIPTFPPIQQLDVTAAWGYSWTQALDVVQDSLVSLCIIIPEGFSRQTGSLDLPRLRYLEAKSQKTDASLHMRLKTPSLLSYLEPSTKHSLGWLVEADFDRVTHLAVPETRVTSNICPLVHLRLPFEPFDLVGVLTRDITLLPELETIEYDSHVGTGFSWSIERQIGGSTHSIDIFPSIDWNVWKVKFPGEFIPCVSSNLLGYIRKLIFCALKEQL